MTGSLQFREYPSDIVRLSCAKCGRSGQYRKQNLIEKYGADIPLPDLREQIANCRHRGLHDGRKVRYFTWFKRCDDRKLRTICSTDVFKHE